MKHFVTAVAISIAAFIPCTVRAQDINMYKKEINDWHAQRIKDLKSDDGWLNLAGLFWLDEGKSSFGSGKKNKLVFPAGKIKGDAGYFERTGNTVKLVAGKDANVKVNDKPIQESIIFDNDASQAAIVSCGDLRWSIIKREEKIGVRLRDLKSKQLANFKDIDRFAVDPIWKIPATLQTADTGAHLLITNVLGQTTAQHSPGKIVFTVSNKTYTLDALEEGDELFIIFADSTSGNSTYPAGRFLYVKKPGADGATFIDFNKAYNPPCAFTNFATCPLPPKQNDLPFAVNAGEKFSGHH